MGIKLSICIATLNRGKYLSETLNSIIPQMNSSVEIIIVDGASTDNTQMVVSEFLSKNINIKYCREEINSICQSHIS